MHAINGEKICNGIEYLIEFVAKKRKYFFKIESYFISKKLFLEFLEYFFVLLFLKAEKGKSKNVNEIDLYVCILFFNIIFS